MASSSTPAGSSSNAKYSVLPTSSRPSSPRNRTGIGHLRLPSLSPLTKDCFRPSPSFLAGLATSTILLLLLHLLAGPPPPPIPLYFPEPSPVSQLDAGAQCLSRPLAAHQPNGSQFETAMDRQMSPAQCDALFPELYREADRARDWYAARGGVSREDLEKAAENANARVIIKDGRMYVKKFDKGMNTRTMASLAAIHEALITSPEPIPDIDFVIQTLDAGYGDRPAWVLDRKADQEALWLMPDFGWWSWPEPGVGSFVEVRDKALAYENSHGYSTKKDKLFWRGAPMVDIRHQLIAAAKGYGWSDVRAMDWGKIQPGDLLTMEEHCGYKYLAHVEGWAYSGRLKYLLQCRSVVVMHPQEFIQHFHHLLDSSPTSPTQNIIEIPSLTSLQPAAQAHVREPSSNPWAALPQVMDALLADPERVQMIADNAWNALRERYLTPAATACYWRRLMRRWSEVQKYEVRLEGKEPSYESFMLMGVTEWAPH